ncbi:MAG TPA: peptidase M24 [Candidatus Methylomirabilis sp.]|nr:peptidase M24 [Candidatus Methylomirabilis sp.]
MTRLEEIREKEERLAGLLKARKLRGILLKRQANFSWLTAGGINLIGIATELGGTSLLVTERGKYVLTSNIEASRMIEEEVVEKLGFQVRTFQWYDDQEAAIVKDLVGDGPIGSDVPSANGVNVAEDVARLRYSLTPGEIERYRWLGEKTSMAAEKTLMETRRGEKECAVIGRLSAELWKDRIDPVGVMGAADDRIARFRHCIPMERPIDRLFMLSVNARKGGLIVCLTRFVHFGPPPAALRAQYAANVYVDCVFMANTRPGILARDVLQKGIEAYRAKGYPEEWKLHHQGGPIGYQPREYRTHFKTPDLVAENQPFCWNPSITGTKSEDTMLATAQGPELITRPVFFPTLALEMEGMRLVRPAILEQEG